MESRVLLQVLLVIFSLHTAAEGKHITKKAEHHKRIAVRDVDVQIDYEPVGCFQDRGHDRALNHKVKNFRNFLGKKLWEKWPDMTLVIQLCAEEAFKQGYTAMFGVQFYGECYSSKNAQSNYDKHGKSNNCVSGVGKDRANFVYRIKVNPIPVKAPNAVCEVEGQTFIDGDDMEVYKGDLANGECEQCTCKDGMLINCHHIFHCVLNDSSCNSYSKKPGQCCPTCERDVPDNAPKCTVKDRLYKEGESMEVLKPLGLKATSECHQCTCKGGELEDCHRIYYCEMNKPGCTQFIKAPGQCCPTCARVIPRPTPPSCKVSGIYYKDGESMEVLKMSADKKTGACHQCTCNNSNVEGCHHIFHCHLNSPDCASYKIVPGQCCPECVPVNPDEHALSCQINGLLFRDGASAEVLKESADKSSIYCQQCQCQSGKHTCHKIYDCDIQKVACEKSVKIPGQCCPSCACYHNGQQLGPGDQWLKKSGSDCIQCTCLMDGTAKCLRVLEGCQSE